MANAQEILPGLVAEVNQIAAAIGISQDDAIVQALEMWKFFVENGLMTKESFSFACWMTSPAGVGMAVRPLSENSSIQYTQYIS